MSDEEVPESGSPDSGAISESHADGMEKSAASKTEEDRKGGKRKYLDTSSKWVSLVAAISALILSLYNFVGLHSSPDVSVTMPNMIRLLSLANQAVIIAQPVISVSNETENTETVTGLVLHLRREGSTAPQGQVDFLWYADGHWQSDVATQKSFWVEDEDAGAFLLAKDKPWTKIMSFRADGWSFLPGRYDATLTVNRATTSVPLEVRWCLLLTSGGADQINVQHAYFPIRKDWPGSSGPKDQQSCYRGEPTGASRGTSLGAAAQSGAPTAAGSSRPGATGAAAGPGPPGSRWCPRGGVTVVWHGSRRRSAGCRPGGRHREPSRCGWRVHRVTATDTDPRPRACPLGTWETAFALPHPRLRPGVIGYRGLRLAFDRPRRRLEAPVGAATLLLAFEDHPITLTRLGRQRPPVTLVSVLSGLSTGPMLAVHGGRLCGVEVNFAPWMAFTLLGLDQHELAGGPVDPFALPGDRIRALTDALAEAPDWEARFELLDSTLQRWARRGPSPAPQTVRAWAELTRTAGTVPVPRLADEVGWSVRKLENCFREQIGQRPKAAARVLRIQRARRLLVSGERASVVAASCGFYDQAHLCGEFKAMTGCTVRTFMAERARDHGGPPMVDRLPGEVTSLVLAG
ncbi:hypothetical protein GCM10010430_36340 [Kitasatospora cystarginea]|uniref:HTH araC/xylS-type domain-containing protein n=2 Tax=Kitasatospora cystarginea TaxID=58350 RepID=A0ABP5R325_9ACTN